MGNNCCAADDETDQNRAISNFISDNDEVLALEKDTNESAPNEINAIDKAIFRLQNKVRTNPRSFVTHLEKYRKRFDTEGIKIKLDNGVWMRTKEGVKAVDECIDALKKAQPAKPLQWSAGLYNASVDHVNDCGPRGKIGHTGSDGSTAFDRISRYGEWEGPAAENCNYGPGKALDIICQLLVDDGVQNRGHRNNLLNPEYGVTGSATSPHALHDFMCCITYAKAFTAGSQSPRMKRIKNAVNQDARSLESGRLPQGTKTSKSVDTRVEGNVEITTTTVTHTFPDGSMRTEKKIVQRPIEVSGQPSAAASEKTIEDEQ